MLPGLGERYVQDREARAALVKGYENAVDHLLDDQVISADEEVTLAAYASSIGLSEGDCNRNGAHTRVRMGVVLRQVLEGETPEQQLGGQAPFNLQKSEKCVCVPRS